MNNIRIRTIQVLVEALLPILGFIFWNWSFYYILLFYFLDFLAASVLTIFKIKKIMNVTDTFKKEKIKPLSVVYAVLINFGIFILAYLVLLNLNSNFDVIKESINFVMLEDMGMPQGIFLIPLVIYASYLNYKTQFLVPKRYQVLGVTEVFNQYFKGIMIALIGFFVAFGVTKLSAIPEIICVIILVTFISLYSFFEKNK